MCFNLLSACKVSPESLFNDNLDDIAQQLQERE